MWVALSDSTVESGCVRVLPGTHLDRDYDHVETYDPDNLLSRGQTIEGLDESTAVNMELRSGQFSLHHEKLLHGSAPNRSDYRRLGISLVCIPARCRSVIGRRGAVLLRGFDADHHWDADPEPRFDLDPVSMAALEEFQQAYRNPAARPEAERAKDSP